MLLEVCTVLGGLSAIWFFFDKIQIFLNKHGFQKLCSTKSTSILALSDEEFMLIDKLLKFPYSKEYLSSSPEEKNTFNSLVNLGYFSLSNKNSYVPTKKFESLKENLNK